jgi:lipopolysaccharide assembly protein A
VNRDTIIPRIKLVVLLLLAVLAVVLILQNTQGVTTRLLFVTVSMPLAALLALTLLIGFAGGVLVALKVGKRN